MVSAHLSVIPEFVEKIELLELEDSFTVNNTEIINKQTGSRILFRGLKTGAKIQTAALKSIAGLTTWVLDEAEELHDQTLFDTINFSIRTVLADNEVILVFNPPTKKHWLYTKWFLDKGIEPGSNLTYDNITYIHTSYLDNYENLNKDIIKEFEELKIKDYDKYNNIILGGFKDKAEGLIITNWELGNFPNVSAEYGLDFGFSNDPTALVKCHIDHSKKLLYVKGLLYQTGIIPSKLATLVSNICGRDLIIADSASPDIIAELKNGHCNILPVSKPKIVDRLEMLRDYKIIVDPESKDIINEFNEYCWDENYALGDRPVDKYNHYVDAINYYIVYRGRNKKVERYRIR